MGDDRIDGPTTRAATRPQAVAARLNRRLRLSHTLYPHRRCSIRSERLDPIDQVRDRNGSALTRA